MRKCWTRAECEDLEAVELIEGELIEKLPKKRPQVAVLMSVLEWMIAAFGLSYLNLQGPIDVAPEDNPTSQPEPDIAVLTRTAPEYMSSGPPASDVRLVVEISDSTLAFHLGPKARLYARAEIPEYWVFDVNGRRLIVHRAPRDGSYSTAAVYVEGESITSLALPDKAFSVADAFPFPKPRT